MDLILDLDKRSGRLLGPFIALYSVERLELPDFVPDGTSVALLTPSGETLALALSQGHAVTLDTNTTQAAAYAAGLPVGRSLNAFVVVGDTDNLLATVPVLVVANALDALAPPTQSAPHYPTSEALQAILNEMAELASAASKASEAVAQDAQRVDRLVNVALPQAVEEIDTHLDERVRAAEKTIERAAVDSSTALDGKVATASTALDNKLSAAQTALDGKVSAANDAAIAADGSAKAAKKARDDAEAAKGLAADSAKNASKSAEQAKTSETNAKTTADGLSAGLATLNGLDGRVGTLETQVAPTMAGGLLDVQLGHNAMVKVCKATKENRKIMAEIVKPFGYSVNVENGANRIYVAGVGNFWFVCVTCVPSVAFVCDPNLNYKFAIDGANPLADVGNNPKGQVFDGCFGNFTGNGIAVNTENTRIWHAYAEYRDQATGEPMAFFIQSWDATTGEKLVSKKHTLGAERKGIKSDLSLVYLPNVKMLLVGGKVLVDCDTLEVVGDITDATTQAGTASVITARYNANPCLIKKYGLGVTFNNKRLAVLYSGSIAPVYVDDFTNPANPTLRNFVDKNGNAVTQAYSHLACAELVSSWANHMPFLMRVASNKLVVRRVALTFPSDTATLSVVVDDEVTSDVNMEGYATLIPSQGFFKGSSNANQVLALIAYGGAIVQQVTVSYASSKTTVSSAVPAIDTMVDQGTSKKDKSPVAVSRQTDYGYIITQSGSLNQKSAISVILNRPLK